MLIQTLDQLWKKKKRSLGGRLQKGIGDLSYVLRSVADENKYLQFTLNNEIHWINSDSKITVMFFYINDPRNFEMVADVFQRTKETQCELACVFIHQWKDGEGNWDVFGLHPQRGLVHWNRFWGQRWLANDTGPFLREDIFTLFNCDHNFPLFSRRKWLNLLVDSKEKTNGQLAILAEKYDCSQNETNNLLRWQNTKGITEAQFSIFQDFPSLDDYIKIYKQIKIENCPVTFLFQRAHPEVFDIFRFSARTYMEHHNQVK